MSRGALIGGGRVREMTENRRTITQHNTAQQQVEVEVYRESTTRYIVVLLCIRDKEVQQACDQRTGT